MTALLPLLQKTFGEALPENVEKGKKKLEEMEAQIKKIHDAFLGMMQKPTAAEEESAANIKAIMEDKPTAERVAKGIAQSIGRKSVEGEYTPEEMAEIGKLNELDLPESEMPVDKPHYQQAAFKGEMARRREVAIENAARKRVAERMVVAAAGPGGEGARNQIIEMATAQPELFPKGIARDLIDASPEKQRERDQADEAWEEELGERSAAVKRRNTRRGEKERADKKREADKKKSDHDRAQAAHEWAEDNEHAQHYEQEAAKAQSDLEKRLGDTFMAQAEREMLAAGSGGQQKVIDKITRAAQQKLMQSGLPADQAAMQAAGAHGMMMQDINRQLQLMGPQGKGREGQQSLFFMLGQVLENQQAMAEDQKHINERLAPMNARVRSTIQSNRTAASNGMF